MDINATIKAIRQSLNFDRFDLDLRTLSKEEKALLTGIPRVSSRCSVLTHPNKVAGSAFNGMRENAVVAGFMRTEQGIQVLVIFSDRIDADTKSRDFAFVSLKQVRAFSDAPPVKRHNVFSI